MPNVIQHKRNSTPGSVPNATGIQQGELAINIGDGRLYTKNSSNTVINLGITSISGTTITPASGNFSSSLQVNSVNVSLTGHTHTSSDITNFNSSVSGLLPTVANSGNNRVLTSTGTTVGVSGQTNLVFTGSNLGVNTSSPSGAIHVVGSGLVSSVTGTVPNSLFHVYSATSGANIFNVEGTNGSLFSVVDSLSGSLMSVNNNAGLPVFEVFSDDRVVAGRYNQNDLVVTSGGNVGIGVAAPTNKLQVLGNSLISGVLSVTSGNFNTLQVGGTGVSISGHTHTSSDITNFNSSVSGLVSGVYAPLSGKLNQFASTSSSELFGVISDETGSGLLVFNNSPTLTGIPLTPTASSGTNTNQIASTAFVRTEISNLVASAPATLDTLNELAAALGNDANFSTTVTNNLAGKANLSGASFTGNVSAPTGNFTVLQQNGVGVSTVGHSHTSSNITDFNSSVGGLVSGVYVPVTRTITPGSGLVGSSGLDLSTDRTLHVGQGDGLTVSADTIAVNNTVLRTTGNQVITGDKQFRTPLYAVSGIVINGYVDWLTRYGNQLDIAYQLENGYYLAQFNTSSNVNLNSINLNAVTTFNKVSSDGALPFVISPTGYSGSGAVTQGYWRGETIEVNKGGTGRTSYSNGQLLIGSGTGLATNTLTAGTGIAITNGSGTITISTSGLASSNITDFREATIGSTLYLWANFK